MRLTHSLCVLMVLFFAVISLEAQTELSIGDKHFELHAYELAIISYEKYALQHPEDYTVLKKLGSSYRLINRLKDASNWYAKANAIEPLTGDNLQEYVTCLIEQGAYDEALTKIQHQAKSKYDWTDPLEKKCRFAKEKISQPGYYAVKREHLSTNEADFGVAFWGDEVVFSSSRTDIERNFTAKSADWTGNPSNQLFVTMVDENGFLKKPDFLRGDIKNKYNEGQPSVSSKNDRIVFTKNNFINGTRQISDAGAQLTMYTAKLNASGTWVNTQPFPFNYGGYSVGYPHLTENGNTLYFASNQPDGYGGFDLYVSYWRNDNWTIPENLGPSVNTSGNEVSPFKTNQELFFSSDYHLGFGGLDVFRAVSQNNKDWTIYHLGTGINSPLDDYGFIYDPSKNLGYLTSNREGSFSHEDIYKVELLAPQFTVQVLDTDNQPVGNANVDFSACNMGSFTTNNDGKFTFRAYGQSECVGLVSKAGFDNKSFPLKSAQGMITVTLKKNDASFFGQVKSKESSEIIKGAHVSALDLQSNQKIHAQTDESGKFWLNLEQGKSYTVELSKAGFENGQLNLKVANGMSENLGTVWIEPSGTNISTTTDSDKTVKPAGKVFAVQVEAVFSNAKLSMDKYANLADLGFVYTKSEAESTKVRIGMFDSYELAGQIKEEIISLGYKDAFVVREEETNLMNQILTSMTDRNAPDEPMSSQENTDKDFYAYPASENAMTQKMGKYKVRLATYKDKKWFRPETVVSLGPVREMPYKDGMVIMMIDGYDDLKTALTARNLARDAGFTTAKVVTENDKGELVRVE